MPSECVQFEFKTDNVLLNKGKNDKYYRYVSHILYDTPIYSQLISNHIIISEMYLNP